MNAISSVIEVALKRKTTIEREDIASLIGISRRTLDAVTRGKSNLSVDQIVKLSEIIQVDLFKQYFAKIGRIESSIVEEEAPAYTLLKKEISLNFALKANVEGFGEFQNFLNELRKISAKYGYEIL